MKPSALLKSVFVFIFVFSAAFCAAAPAQWPTWRGPDMAGISEGTPPLTWSETENIQWKAALEGDSSNSTPVVWDDKLFFQIAVKTDQQPEGDAAVAEAPAAPPAGGRGGRGVIPKNLYQFKVVCVDRNTGKTLWQTQVCQVVPHEGHHGDHGFASFSPVTDGVSVWANFGSRGVYCLTLDGKIKWQKDLGKTRMAAGFGEGSSPLLVEDKLIVLMDQEDQSCITALNKDSGQIAWKKDRDEKSSWTSPMAVKVEGKTQIVVNGYNRVRSYDPATGDVLWECGGQTANPIPTPVTGLGMVFCASGFRGSKLAAITLGKTGDLTGTDAVVWEVNEATPYVPSPLLCGEKLYALSGNKGVVSCYNAKTGKPYYTQQAMPEIQNIYASPLGAAGRVYFVGRNGVTYVLNNNTEAFEVLAVNRLDDNIDCSPVVIGDTLYLKGKKFLYCIAGKK